MASDIFTSFPIIKVAGVESVSVCWRQPLNVSGIGIVLLTVCLFYSMSNSVVVCVELFCIILARS